MGTQTQRTMAAVAKQRPEGWPVGSFATYEQAQAAVDMLSDQEFPVNDLTIVGVDLMEVERVVGRLTWPKVLAGGAVSGAWMGLFFGLVVGFLFEDWVTPLITGLSAGIVFGLLSVSVPYAASRGKRDFSSTTAIVAGRYDVLCNPRTARQARDAIAGAQQTFHGSGSVHD